MPFRSAVETVLALVEAYFHLRNVDAVMNCVTEDVIWVGMEAGESYFGKAAVKAMLEADMAAHPGPYETRIRECPREIRRREDWVTVVAVGERQVNEAHSFTVRSTVECVKGADGWRINSIHTSVPNMVEEKLRLKTKLTEEQRKQEMLMRGIPGGVAIYRLKKDGTVPTDYVSEGLARSLGYTAEEFLAVLQENALCNLIPEDVPGVMEKAMEGLERNTPISAVYRVYDKAHRPVRIRLDANIIKKEPKPDEMAVLYAVHTIVSESAEDAIREQHLYRRLLDNLDIAYFEVREDGTFYTSERYFQYAISQTDLRTVVTGPGARENIHPDDIPVLVHFFQKKHEKEPKVSVTLRCKMTDGTYRWTEMMGIFDYAQDGTPIRQIGVFRDAENEWTEQNRRLTEALETARQASRSKTEFFSRVSHDIRTPLNAILGFSRIAQESAGNTEKYIGKIQNSGEYLLGLINDVLDMSKIESESFELREEAVDVQEFLKGIADMFAQVASQNGVRLETDFSGIRKEWVLLDKLRLKQIYSNLLSNAIKFSPAGAVVTWSATHHLRDGVIESVSVIQDEGCGMSEEFLKKVFQPFAQETNEYSDNMTGTGLGLAIVKNLVTCMKGEIQIESKLKIGTKVTLHLHQRLVPEPVEPQAGGELHPAGVSLQGRRILLCEDNALNREIAVHLLKKEGMEVEQAENGREGLKKFQASAVGWFDAILMDIRMPVMDGLACARQIRSLSEVRTDAKTVPIIAMTANAYAEDVEAVLEAGMNDHLSKPVNPEKMYEIIAKYCGKR